MPKREVRTITRQEYKARLDLGEKYRGAGLYEMDHCGYEVEFVYVQLTPTHRELKRRIK